MKPLPPWHSSASTTTGVARLQFQYFAIGAPMRPISFSASLPPSRSSAWTKRKASQAEASAYSARSAMTFVMIGWSISAFWKARRWAV